MSLAARVREIELPWRVESEANLRDHWRTKARRAKKQRFDADLFVSSRFRSMRGYTGRLLITLTRIAPRKLDDDNLARSFKAIRDGVADALQVNDGSARIEWKYQQQRRRPGEYSALIRIEWEE